MEDIPPEELNSLLAHFFIKVKKLSGEELEPPLLILLSRIPRKFRQRGYIKQFGVSY